MCTLLPLYFTTLGNAVLLFLQQILPDVTALHQLIDMEKVDRDERVVLFNTGSGLKYLSAFKRSFSSVEEFC
ncbi:MAG: hypothetical protein F6K28_52380 [Microcoleus sp. SIO2G3]|nr:hypothetical protein [Microcoleus sp. SIO2G3]